MSKILLIWEEFPENTKLYEFDDTEGNELTKLVLESHGGYINAMPHTESDHPVHKLSEVLPNLNPINTAEIVTGDYQKIVMAGIFM